MKIEISDETYRELEDYFKVNKGFSSVGELLEYILRSFIEQVENKENIAEGKSQGEIEDPSHLKQVEQRLKDLGYL